MKKKKNPTKKPTPKYMNEDVLVEEKERNISPGRKSFKQEVTFKLFLQSKLESREEGKRCSTQWALHMQVQAVSRGPWDGHTGQGEGQGATEEPRGRWAGAGCGALCRPLSGCSSPGGLGWLQEG